MKTKTYIYGIACFSDETTLTSRDFVTKEAFSNWANRQFKKDHCVRIYEYQYNTQNYDFKCIAEWRE